MSSEDAEHENCVRLGAAYNSRSLRMREVKSKMSTFNFKNTVQFVMMLMNNVEILYSSYVSGQNGFVALCAWCAPGFH